MVYFKYYDALLLERDHDHDEQSQGSGYGSVSRTVFPASSHDQWRGAEFTTGFRLGSVPLQWRSNSETRWFAQNHTTMRCYCKFLSMLGLDVASHLDRYTDLHPYDAGWCTRMRRMANAPFLRVRHVRCTADDRAFANAIMLPTLQPRKLGHRESLMTGRGTRNDGTVAHRYQTVPLHQRAGYSSRVHSKNPPQRACRNRLIYSETTSTSQVPKSRKKSSVCAECL